MSSPLISDAKSMAALDLNPGVARVVCPCLTAVAVNSMPCRTLGGSQGWQEVLIRLGVSHRVRKRGSPSSTGRRRMQLRRPSQSALLPPSPTPPLPSACMCSSTTTRCSRFSQPLSALIRTYLTFYQLNHTISLCAHAADPSLHLQAMYSSDFVAMNPAVFLKGL